MILLEWLEHASKRLAVAGIDSPSLEAQILAGHVLLKDRPWIVAHPDAEINVLAAESVLQRREGREPLAYILGWREFYGRRFRVRPGVLIPRQDTEILLETALELTKTGPVLDLGTGSGCLAATIKLERPDLIVHATDISDLALDVARENAENLGAQVEFVRSDGFEAISDQYELIVTNPPYVADHEVLMPEVALHEPSNALYAGPTGLEFYMRLASEAGQHLLPNGILAMELGHTQAIAATRVFVEQGWHKVEIRKDLSGIDRVLVVQWTANSRPAII